MGALFPALVYALCFLTGTLCAFLLGRSYVRTRSRLLFWSSLCFLLLAAANFVVVLDMLVYPEVELQQIRLWLSLAGVAVLMLGFIWDEDQ